MKKTIGILTKKGSLSSELQPNVDLNIFELENNKVIGYENVKIEEEKYESFPVLLENKNINLLYMNNISYEMKRILTNMGIGIKCKNEFSDDQFINQFIFD